METVEHDVVTGVDDGCDPGRIDDANEAREQPGRADATGERHEHGARVTCDRDPYRGGSPMPNGVIDEHFLRRYREMLDAEDAAFDELEHAFEDGDRAHFEADMRAWCDAINRKLQYLQRSGVANINALVVAS